MSTNLPQYLFNRKWGVTLKQVGSTDKGNLYTSLKTVFDIDKSSYSSSNKSKIEIYNLTETQRKGIAISNPQTGQLGDFIRLDAGYQGLLETLYVGDVVRATTERKGADIVTSFELGDSEKQLVYAHFEQSYPPGTTLAQIVIDCIDTLGVDEGIIDGIPDKTYNSGISFSGTVKSVLDKILNQPPLVSLEWSVQNGEINILPLTKTIGTEAFLVSSKTGMIGIPSQGEGFVQFTMLLNPKLIPGTLVLLQTKTINGTFKIRRAHFEGDSHGQKWQVECEATPIFAAQALPASNNNVFGTLTA